MHRTGIKLGVAGSMAFRQTSAACCATRALIAVWATSGSSSAAREDRMAWAVSRWPRRASPPRRPGAGLADWRRPGRSRTARPESPRLRSTISQGARGRTRRADQPWPDGGDLLRLLAQQLFEVKIAATRGGGAVGPCQGLESGSQCWIGSGEISRRAFRRRTSLGPRDAARAVRRSPP